MKRDVKSVYFWKPSSYGHGWCWINSLKSPFAIKDSIFFNLADTVVSWNPVPVDTVDGPNPKQPADMYETL